MFRRCAVSSIFFAIAVLSATINVPADLPSIQMALDNALEGDRIRVAAGTYAERLSFPGATVRVSGESRAVTVLDASALSSNSAGGVVSFASGEGPETVLERFTITGGAARLGGGISISNSAPTIRSCRVIANHGELGGGIYAAGSTTTVSGCVIVQNEAQEGVGLYISNGSPMLVENCLIAQNDAYPFFGFGYGGGILTRAYAVIRNCTIAHNLSENLGGGLRVRSYDVTGPIVENCILWANTPDEVWEFSPETFT